MVPVLEVSLPALTRSRRLTPVVKAARLRGRLPLTAPRRAGAHTLALRDEQAHSNCARRASIVLSGAATTPVMLVERPAIESGLTRNTHGACSQMIACASA